MFTRFIEPRAEVGLRPFHLRALSLVRFVAFLLGFKLRLWGNGEASWTHPQRGSKRNFFSE